MLLEPLWQVLLDVVAHMVPVGAMPVADGEEVQTQLAYHVWHKDVAILVHFLWIIWVVSN